MTEDEKAVFRTAFEIDQRWVVELAADRAPLICQGQSLNLYLRSDIHKWDLLMLHWTAWERGVKSLYYCRSKSVQRAGFAGVEADNTRAWPMNRLVTNEEWMHFMADDGYGRPELWLSDGWARVTAEDWRAPFYWSVDGDGTWHEHTLNGTHPVNPGLPATHLSHYEADAYATWARKRLPTEAEWEHAVVSDGQTDAAGNLADTETFHARAAGPATGHLRQVYGDCWEWTSSSYLPYPGFHPPAGAIGEYNGKFMSNQMVLRGGCALTPPGHARLTYRNFFPPGARWAMSGVRLADGGAPS